MKSTTNRLESRIEKIEASLLKGDDTDEILSSMTTEQRHRRIAELIYKGLSDTDPEVMAMTEEKFIVMYLSMNPDDRDIRYNKPIYEQLTGDQSYST